MPWLVWLNGLSTSLQTKGSPVQFPVRGHAWLQSPGGDQAGGTQRLLHQNSSSARICSYTCTAPSIFLYRLFCYSLYYKRYSWQFLIKLNMQLPYDPAFSLMGIYTKNQKLTFTQNLCSGPSQVAQLVKASS